MQKTESIITPETIRPADLPCCSSAAQTPSVSASDAASLCTALVLERGYPRRCFRSSYLCGTYPITVGIEILAARTSSICCSDCSVHFVCLGVRLRPRRAPQLWFWSEKPPDFVFVLPVLHFSTNTAIVGIAVLIGLAVPKLLSVRRSRLAMWPPCVFQLWFSLQHSRCGG